MNQLVAKGGPPRVGLFILVVEEAADDIVVVEGNPLEQVHLEELFHGQVPCEQVNLLGDVVELGIYCSRRDVDALHHGGQLLLSVLG